MVDRRRPPQQQTPHLTSARKKATMAAPGRAVTIIMEREMEMKSEEESMAMRIALGARTL